MSQKRPESNRRILLVDDNQAIHEDYRKILTSEGTESNAIAAAAAALFDEAEITEQAPMETFEADSAFQGEQALTLVEAAIEEGRPYAVAFVDVRMPPGWDGIETVGRIWEVDEEIQIVLCTAYSDYSWDDMIAVLGHTDRLVILKKPFDNIEVRQLASALTEKWALTRAANRRMKELENRVRDNNKAVDRQKSDLNKAATQLEQTKTQLLQADKMASIGHLAAGVAHELNNPIGFVSSNLNSLTQYVQDLLSVLDAYTELISSCNQGRTDLAEVMESMDSVKSDVDLDFIVSDIRNLIDESIEGTKRVRQIVGDLRDFSHIDSPMLSEEDINQLMEKTINVAWNELKYKTEVVRELGELPPVICFGGKLGQVFLNLLVNASQAINERGTIIIRSGHEGDRVWIEVEDDGAGIAEGDLAQIFDPFFTTKKVGEGTGLGLHLVSSIVQAHDGTINVKSEVGKGTCFRIELPIAGPSERNDENAEAA